MFNINIESNLTNQLNDKIGQIAAQLYSSHYSDIGLMGGKAGEVLFWAYYLKCYDNVNFEGKVEILIKEALGEIKRGFGHPSFSYGLAGFGWTLEHLVRNNFIHIDTNYLLSDLDSYLHNQMLKEIKIGNYDYLHGALGIGLYFLNRTSNLNSYKYLGELIDELDKHGARFNESIAWESKLSIDKEVRGYNLGLSHGLASIIVILSKFYAADIKKEKVAELVNGAINYLYQSKQDPKIYKFSFPSSICAEEQNYGGRLAWCYNDLGISIALWQAGHLLNNDLWKNDAIGLILRTTSFTKLEENGVVDAGLCHGAAGIAHIYNRMYDYTGIEILKSSANYWLEQCLKLAVYQDGLVGYKAFRMPEFGGVKNEYGFLEGIAGIGLSMIYAVTGMEPTWDSALLLS